MKLITNLIGCILLFLSCSGSAPSSKPDKSELTLTTSMKDSDVKEPYLYTVKNNRYDFGTIKEDKIDVIPIDIEIGNSGNSPLVIQKADVSCGRISIEYPKAPVLPGKTAMIHIAVNTKGQKGYFNKTVFLKSNAANDVELIRITGQIK
ncbi:MAG: DUF1573 domain-containing protein [Bacteroides sp.]|nr:DUF1573 domain-containing protein [Bacteroides sp.]